MNKNNIPQFIAKLVFYSLALVLFAWTASLTRSFLQVALPEKPVVAWLGLAVFDIGMLAWLVVFIYYAEGTAQSAISLIGVVLDFVGVAVMVWAEIMIGGQEFTEVPPEVGLYAVYAVIIWTVVNVGLVVGFHLFDPYARQARAKQDAKGVMTDEALKRLTTEATRLAPAVATIVAGEMMQDVVKELTGSTEEVAALPVPEGEESGGRTGKKSARQPSLNGTHG